MKKSGEVALSAVSAALAVALMSLGAFVPTLDLSCVMLSGFALMLPLAKGYNRGAFLSYLATALLSAVITGFRIQVLVPYAIFFGLHPLVNQLQLKFKINKFLAFAVKLVWFIGSCFIVYFFTEMFVVENATIRQYAVYIILIGGSALFVLYDMFVFRMQRAVNYLVGRLKL